MDALTAFGVAALTFMMLMYALESRGRAFIRKDSGVMRAGKFDRGRQVGVWRTFDRTGRLVKETDFSKGD
jgi:hypothetical protein